MTGSNDAQTVLSNVATVNIFLLFNQFLVQLLI